MQIPDIGFQSLDKDGGSGWLSYPKKSSLSAPGRAFGVNKHSVMITAFASADPSFVATFFRFKGDLLLNVCKPAGMALATGLEAFNSVSNKFYEPSLVISRASTQTVSNFKVNGLSCI